MIIKPIANQKELEQYLIARRKKNGNLKVTNTIEKNIANEHEKYEIDAYDTISFHFGAFENEQLYACTRLVCDKYDTSKKPLYEESKINHLFKEFADEKNPENAIGLLEYTSKKEDFNEINSFLETQRKNARVFSEITRLIRVLKNDNKHLMNYMICYAWAVNRFKNIDYCFFEANKIHSDYYESNFNCKPILKHIKLNPVKGGEDFYMMQATMRNLNPKMELIVQRIEDKFKKTGNICEINIDEII